MKTGLKMWLYLALGLIALLIYIKQRRKFTYWEKRGVPTASGCEWFFGHVRTTLFMTKHVNEIYEAMYKEFPDAPLVGYHGIATPGLLVRDLDIIKHIMVSDFASFNCNGLRVNTKVDVLTGSNPFFLVGEEWKTARSYISPALTLTKLKGYLPSILKVGDEMVRYVKSQATPCAVLETRDIATKYTTDVIANAIFGVKNNTFENKDSLFGLLTKNIRLNIGVATNMKFFLQQIPLVRSLFPARFTLTKLEDMMISLVSKIITERKATGEKRNDVFHVMMALKKNDTEVLPNDRITGYVFTIIVDLYDTSSNVIAFILYKLSRHPEVQEKLREELRKMKPKNFEELTIEDIENAKYLDMVICESFRTYTLLSTRECTEDCYLPVPNSKPIKIAKGTAITIPTSSIHMDAKYYSDPETFNPERFREEEVAKRPKFTYMPFGEGPKMCMGWRLATLQIKVALMKIIESFNLSPSQKTKFPLTGDPAAPQSIRPKDDAWVVFEEVK